MHFWKCIHTSPNSSHTGTSTNKTHSMSVYTFKKNQQRREVKRQKAGAGDSSICWFISQMLQQTAGSGQGPSQDLECNSGFTHKWPKHLITTHPGFLQQAIPMRNHNQNPDTPPWDVGTLTRASLGDQNSPQEAKHKRPSFFNKISEAINLLQIKVHERM